MLALVRLFPTTAGKLLLLLTMLSKVSENCFDVRSSIGHDHFIAINKMVGGCLGSARVSRAGCDVSPQRTFLPLLFFTRYPL